MILIQERYKDDPWKVLVCCILLNRIRGKQVDVLVDRFFRICGSGGEFLELDRDLVIGMLRPLGLVNRRYEVLIRMTEGYLRGIPVDALFGIGKYALDSYRMFVEGGGSFRASYGSCFEVPSS